MGFPIVEQAKMTQISHLRLELEDLRQIEKSIQLNDNQKIVLEWLKSETILTREAPILSVNAFSDKNLLGKLPDKVRKAYKLLACKQEYEVLSAFAQWGLEQEEAE
ncbi:hypothetical protein AS257_05150 [Enterococcus faecium]|nr:hypothetical protein AS221_01535 [Enterococcus faecium]KWX94923.1 hypothetical protein AS220_01860 [Enterococcus faecium]KWX97455.1 hypothetical protein AS225_11740 [Enterococcus faecium]KWY03765.1 hypothetical protein AS223_04010 [Enterococcus faecium]KWY12170.1 hypothetical protein AS226_14125 [Enterococcus faecium]